MKALLWRRCVDDGVRWENTVYRLWISAGADVLVKLVGQCNVERMSPYL